MINWNKVPSRLSTSIILDCKLLRIKAEADTLPVAPWPRPYTATGETQGKGWHCPKAGPPAPGLTPVTTALSCRSGSRTGGPSGGRGSVLGRCSRFEPTSPRPTSCPSSPEQRTMPRYVPVPSPSRSEKGRLPRKEDSGPILGVCVPPECGRPGAPSVRRKC